MKKAQVVGMTLISSVLLVASASAHAGISSGPVDLEQPFTCKDISPTPMRITEKGLIMGGVLYPLHTANASSTPAFTTTIFRSRDHLEEIDVVQKASNGSVNVSYMKFRANPDQFVDDVSIENNKIFEKGSFDALNPGPRYHSRNQGCKQ